MEMIRCTLKKDARKVILQGMIHMFYEPFQVWVNKDMKNQRRNGYTVFYEGVRKYKNDKREARFSEKESDVHKCKQLFDGIKDEMMKSLNLTAQFDDGGIDYPEDAINIDISYVEYIRLLSELLDKENIDCKKVAHVFDGIPREEIVSKAAKAAENLLTGKAETSDLHTTAMTVDFFRIANLVDLDHRSNVAARKIDKISKRKKIDRIYVHYGNFHIEGIADALVDKYGWKIIKAVKIDSQNPQLR